MWKPTDLGQSHTKLHIMQVIYHWAMLFHQTPNNIHQHQPSPVWSFVKGLFSDCHQASHSWTGTVAGSLRRIHQSRQRPCCTPWWRSPLAAGHVTAEPEPGLGPAETGPASTSGRSPWNQSTHKHEQTNKIISIHWHITYNYKKMLKGWLIKICHRLSAHLSMTTQTLKMYLK